MPVTFTSGGIMTFAQKLRFGLLTICILALAPTAFAGPPRFTTIDYPGAVATFAFGINPAGDLVGGYYDNSYNEHGFVLHKGQFVSFDYPGAVWSEGEAITPQGDILGQYGLPDNTVHGFLLRRGGFIPVDVPNQANDVGLPNTMPVHISPSGSIMGCYHQSEPDGSVNLDTMYGFEMNAHGITSFWEARSMHNGINPASDVVGILYSADGKVHQSYVIKDGVTSWFQFPGSIATQAWDISPTGVMVGFHRNATGVHGFVRRGEDMTSFDVPGASATYPFGVNAIGDITGYFNDATGSHAFLLSRQVTD
jgi:hypothetical protein